MGAALVSMVCNLTIGKKKYAEVEAEMKDVLAKAEALAARLTGMIEDDVQAFDAVMGAYGMPRRPMPTRPRAARRSRRRSSRRPMCRCAAPAPRAR